MAERDEQAAPRAERDERTCRPCRGTGNVISGLGGEPRDVPCPWCGGGGVRVPGRNAQEAAAAARAAG
jgi:DnaJ-class molecular chaperone